MTLEEINRTLVAANGGCWHEWEYGKDGTGSLLCSCNVYITCNNHEEHRNPDFSQWANFGRLLKLIEKNHIHVEIYGYGFIVSTSHNRNQIINACNIDQIPLLVATELARILREGK